MHPSLVAVLLHHSGLTILQNLRLELHGTGLVVTVNIPEGRGEHERSKVRKAFVHLDHVFGRGVELGVIDAGVVHAFFHTTDDTRLDFEDDLIGSTELDDFLAQAHVHVQRQVAGIEHVRLEQVATTSGPALGGLFDQRLEELVDLTAGQ